MSQKAAGKTNALGLIAVLLIVVFVVALVGWAFDFIAFGLWLAIGAAVVFAVLLGARRLADKRISARDSQALRDRRFKG